MRFSHELRGSIITASKTGALEATGNTGRRNKQHVVDELMEGLFALDPEERKRVGKEIMAQCLEVIENNKPES